MIDLSDDGIDENEEMHRHYVGPSLAADGWSNVYREAMGVQHWADHLLLLLLNASINASTSTSTGMPMPMQVPMPMPGPMHTNGQPPAMFVALRRLLLLSPYLLIPTLILLLA